MSHTTKIGATVFIHNGDFSGDIEIVRPDGKLTVPFEDVASIVAEFVKQRRIEDLESAIPLKLLFGPGGGS